MDRTIGAWTFEGDGIRYRIVSDGRSLERPGDLFSSVSLEDLMDEVGDALTPEGLLEGPYQCGLLQTAAGLILLDAGMGLLAREIGAPAGRLVEELALSGIGPDDIDTVVISHAHLDHIGGLLRNGRPRFASARHVLARAEWDFWMSGDCERRLSGEMRGSLIGAARGHLPTLRDAGVLELLDDETVIAPGVSVVPAPGHTPGHVVVVMRAGSRSCLYLADTVIHEVQVKRPDWTSVVDVDPAETVSTRVAWLERAASAGSMVSAFHVGKTGWIERVGRGYRLRASDRRAPVHPGVRSTATTR